MLNFYSGLKDIIMQDAIAISLETIGDYLLGNSVVLQINRKIIGKTIVTVSRSLSDLMISPGRTRLQTLLVVSFAKDTVAITFTPFFEQKRRRENSAYNYGRIASVAVLYAQQQQWIGDEFEIGLTMSPKGCRVGLTSIPYIPDDYATVFVPINGAKLGPCQPQYEHRG